MVASDVSQLGEVWGEEGGRGRRPPLEGVVCDPRIQVRKKARGKFGQKLRSSSGEQRSVCPVQCRVQEDSHGQEQGQA